MALDAPRTDAIDSLIPIEDAELEKIKHLVTPRALNGETMLLNMGPQHPSTHGVLRLLLELDGETVEISALAIGNPHRSGNRDRHRDRHRPQSNLP